jgi:energy-coupling factor transporter ATP-binding protein EcfA2
MDIENKWYKIMAAMNLSNSNHLTFKISHIHSKPFGYNCVIEAPFGLSFDDLETHREQIENSFPCLLEFNPKQLTNKLDMNIITTNFDYTRFKLYKSHADEMFCGIGINGQPILISMNRKPNVLISGTTGSGKSRLVMCMLTNLAQHEVLFYLVQIAKHDLDLFESMKQTKKIARSLEETLKVFIEIENELKRRENLFISKGYLNIEEYNAKFKPLPVIYLFADELSFYMPDKTDNKQEKVLKGQCLDTLKKIMRVCRSGGGFVILSVQISTAEDLPTFAKKLTNVKIALTQATKISSQNIIESSMAFGLPQRQAIVFCDKYTRVYVPTIDKDIIKNLIQMEKKTDNVIKFKKISESEKYEVITDPEEVKKYRESKKKKSEIDKLKDNLL